MLSDLTKRLGRMAPPEIDPLDAERMAELCDYIEDGRGVDEVKPFLAEWNALAYRDYEKHEFESYYQSIDKEVFVEDALLPAGQRIDDLDFSEAEASVAALLAGDLGEAQTSFLMRMLEANFPGSQLSDLIYWPGEWFGDPGAADLELTAEQITVYIAARSQRPLQQAPSVHLPRPVPEKR